MEKKIIKKTRNRVAVVCANCKLKKVKCDREKPCYNCVRNGLADSCTYETRQVSRRRNRRKTASITMPKDNSCGVPENESLSDYKSSITDYEIGSTFKKFILQKPSNTQLKSFDFLIYFGGRNLLSYKFLLAIKEIFNDERRWWKLNRIKSNQMFQSIQWNTYEGDDCNPKLNFKIEKLIRNNYYAILERLTYFQTDLNLILFNSYIPMAVVHSIFHHYISITPVGAIFKRPKKCYEYSFLALIMSLVELTNIFTQPEPARFQFQLVCSPNEFNNISLELLNSSNYLRKCTIFSVYTLLNLRLTLMIYGNSHSAGFNMQNSHSLFFNAVKLCMHMGIHVDQDEVEYLSIEKTLHDYEDVFFCKNIPAESLKKLWNYLLVLDAIYFIESSRTPTIDDRYCHGYYKLVGDGSKNLEHYLLVIKNISLSLSSKSCSLKILLQNISNLSEIVSTYGVFADLQHLERNESQWHEFYLKIKFLKFLLILLFQLHLFLQHDSLSEVYPSKIFGDKENKKYIEKLKKEVDMKCKIIYIIGLNLIAKISQGQLSSKFIIYIKEIFPTWIGVHTMSFVDLIINDNIEKKIKPDIKYCVHSLSKDTLFNTTELEHLLYSYRSPKSEKTLDHFKDSLTIERLTSYLAYVYESIIKVSALYSDYNFFVTTKMFLFCFYFLFCYLKVNSQISISVTNTSERLRDEVKTVAEKYLKNNKSPSELLRENANELAESMSPEFLLKSKECNIESMEDNNLVTLPIPLTDLDLPIFQQEEFLSLFRDVDHYVSDIFGDFWK